tara:strand:- start:398 stop:703 length:306 start_codon:yes stop_codon:yes gene_type:complete
MSNNLATTTTSILTSDRYVAIKSATGLTYNKTLRVLTRGNNGAEIVPCKWNDRSNRLESLATEGPSVPAMYAPTPKLIAKLERAGMSFQFINEAEAKSLTA